MTQHIAWFYEVPFFFMIAHLANGLFNISHQRLALFYFVAITTTPPWCEVMINNINWPSKGFPINAIIDSACTISLCISHGRQWRLHYGL